MKGGAFAVRLMIKEELLTAVKADALPGHIAIIMDGNGRWAKKHSLPLREGHRKGAEMLRRILLQCEEIGIETVSVYAFSTENWKRSYEEVSFIMNLILEYLKREIRALHARNIRIIPIGRLDSLPPKLLAELEKARHETASNTGLTLNAALNYGSREEIVGAVKKLVSLSAAGILDAEKIDEELLSANLYTAGQNDPDLLIRTSGEERLSNFMLWQAAYSELYFSPVLWPEFDEMELLKAVLAYQKRNRRFGGR
jgi:undecaprenyl diphosphate synthase